MGLEGVLENLRKRLENVEGVKPARAEALSEKSKARVWNAGIAKIVCCLLLFFTARSKRFISFLFRDEWAGRIEKDSGDGQWGLVGLGGNWPCSCAKRVREISVAIERPPPFPLAPIYRFPDFSEFMSN